MTTKYIKFLYILNLKSSKAENNTSKCPHCKSNYIVKNGKNKDKQRYLCRGCNKSFVKDTKTTIYYSKKDVSTWVRYCYLLQQQYSLRKIAKILHMSVTTAFNWRHKILKEIKDNSNDVSLSGTIQCNELFFDDSYKGNHKKENFKLPRESYKRGYPYKIFGRGNYRVCVLAAVDDKKSLFMANSCYGRPQIDTLLPSLQNKIESNSSLLTRPSLALKGIAEKFNLKYVPITLIYSDDRLNNENNIVRFYHKIYGFLKPYKGVASRYLDNYFALFHYTFDKKISKV